MSDKIVLLNKKFFLSFLIIFICFFLDRISKFYIINFFINTNHIDQYINEYLNFTLIWNKGIAFGLLQSKSLIYNLISIFIFFIILFLTYLILKTKIFMETFSLSLIIGGALGNFFDRIYYNSVPDFIDFHFKDFHWFTFNVADIFISLGILILLIFDIFKSNKKVN